MTPAGRDVAQRGRRPRRRCSAGGRSHPVMATAMMTRECVGRKIVRAVAVTAVRDAAAG
jgi:ribosomal protein S14